MTGKLDRTTLTDLVLSRTGAPNSNLLAGPAFGEDAAAIRVGSETLVVSTDPISLAAERIGQLAVTVASNDVAACGGAPEFLLCTVLLPSADPSLLDTITGQLDAESKRLGLTIAGGHTEVVAGLDRPLCSLTCFGTADRFVSTGGATPGDHVLLTKGAGIEATGVLATDFRDRLDLSADALDRATAAFDDLSVIPEAAVLTPVATAMHDPTEGGVLEGLIELAITGDVTLDVDRDAVHVRAETRAACEAVGVDPLRVLGSGALLATVGDDEVDDALAALAAEGIDAVDIGRVEAGEAAVRIDGERYTEPIRDDMYALWGE
ncbi:AIR synthase family protein [Haloplanus aerogenes]|uniref:Hydrogenase expression protein n=1 Tax=Haloplanus aerogenes TaxID=660522 RepID=A0A3M0CK86_9EURY|nr:AIR synthase family protein [Haloplanus aerogenes]AZH26768.1 hydrogenase expression protein [Haloplanus aerogenes]RMB09145.1 hydrogenase expression/formation protein HypE [Haloplanus aerogenes]